MNAELVTVAGRQPGINVDTQWVGSVGFLANRNVIVAIDGSGFATLEAAIAYINTIGSSDTNRWHIYVKGATASGSTNIPMSNPVTIPTCVSVICDDRVQFECANDDTGIICSSIQQLKNVRLKRASPSSSGVAAFSVPNGTSNLILEFPTVKNFDIGIKNDSTGAEIRVWRPRIREGTTTSFIKNTRAGAVTSVTDINVGGTAVITNVLHNTAAGQITNTGGDISPTNVTITNGIMSDSAGSSILCCGVAIANCTNGVNADSGTVITSGVNLYSCTNSLRARIGGIKGTVEISSSGTYDAITTNASASINVSWRGYSTAAKISATSGSTVAFNRVYKNVVTVGMLNNDFGSIEDALAYLATNMSDDTAIVLGAGTISIAATVTINLSYNLEIRGNGFQSTILKATGGFAGTKMFELKSSCCFDALTLDGDNVVTTGVVDTGGTSSPYFWQIQDSMIQKFSKGISINEDDDFWFFNSTCSDNTTKDVEIDITGGGNGRTRIVQVDLSAPISVDLVKATTHDVLLDGNDISLTNSTDIAIKYDGTNFTYSKFTVCNNRWNKTGSFQSGMDFNLTRDSSIQIYSNENYESKYPHCKINIFNNATTATSPANSFVRAPGTNTSVYNCKFGLYNPLSPGSYPSNFFLYQSNKPRDLKVTIGGNINVSSVAGGRTFDFGVMKGYGATGVMSVLITTNGAPGKVRCTMASGNHNVATTPSNGQGVYIIASGYTSGFYGATRVNNTTFDLDGGTGGASLNYIADGSGTCYYAPVYFSSVADAGGGKCTITTPAAHGLKAGDYVWIRFDATFTTAYYLVQTVPTTTTFTVTLAYGAGPSATGQIQNVYSPITSRPASAGVDDALPTVVAYIPDVSENDFFDVRIKDSSSGTTIRLTDMALFSEAMP